MRVEKIFIICFLMLSFLSVMPRLSSAQNAPQAASLGTETGFALPRFVSLSSNEVNLRTGPGLQYPITWVLNRKRLPVEILREFEAWRQIKTHEGDHGWVHKSLLSGKRSARILSEKQPVFAKPSEVSKPLALLETGVILNVSECVEAWCRVEVLNYDGWLPKETLWGVYNYETFTN